MLVQYLKKKLMNLFKKEKEEKNLTSKQIRNIKRRMSKKKEEDEEFIKLAVYGSLRKGFKLNTKYFTGSLFLGTFSSSPEFTMYDLGEYPGVIHNGGTSIVMDVYEINAKYLKIFDIAEGYLDLRNNIINMFKKNTISTPFGLAYYYSYEELDKRIVKPKIIESGDWKDNKKVKK